MNTKALRQKILDIAIHGKLVPQDPNDESATVLLEKIRAEKAERIKKGELKPSRSDRLGSADNPPYQNIAGEIPFDVPSGWAWCRFSDATINRDSERKPVNSNNRKSLQKIYDYYGAAGVIDKLQDYLFDEKLLLIGEDGANLLSRTKNNALIATGKYWVNNHAHVIDCYDKSMLDYLCYFINAIELDDYITGSAQPKFTQKALNDLWIPLPPLSEQRRIVTAIETIFAQIDELERSKSDLQTAVKQAKSKILDLAIRGKLVPQSADDEPAAALLEKVRAEKEAASDNRHYGKLENSTEAEIPFEIPKNWVWCNGSDIFAPMTTRKPMGKVFRYIDIDAIDNKNHCIKSPKEIAVENAPSRASRELRLGDILFSLVRPYLENIALIGAENADCIASTGFYVCRPKKIFDSKFAFYVMTSDYVIKGLNQFMKGDNSPSISGEDITKWLYPLPPISEQKRIVAKIEELFSTLDQIQNNLV